MRSGFYVIEQGNNCNLRCKSCPTRLNVRPKGFMTPETFRSIIDQNLAHNPNFRGERVVLHGYGEFLLSPYKWETLDYLQDKQFCQVDFSDNAMLLTEEIIRKLCTYRIFPFLKFSLNSSRKELMEYINTGSDFYTVVRNIQMFCDIAKETSWPTSIVVQLLHTSKNLDETEQEVKDVIQRNNFRIMEFTIMSMLNMDSSNDLLVKDYTFWDGRCDFSVTSMMYHWDGDIVGCCVDNTKSQVFGNVSDGIWSSKVQDKRNQFRNELKNRNYINLPACSVCEGKACVNPQ